MQSHLEKLQLNKGDIIVVRDPETLHYLSQFPFKLDFNVPLVFSPQGIQKLSRSDLLNLMEQLDQAESPIVGAGEATAAPV